MVRHTLGGVLCVGVVVCGAGCSNGADSGAGPERDATVVGAAAGGASSGSGGGLGSGGTTAAGGGGSGGIRGSAGASDTAGTAGAGGRPQLDAGSHTPPPPDSGASLPGWTLTWSDEFDGPPGAAPDATKWVHETGGNGWGNSELEYYTDRTDNSALDGQGSLVITAKAESFMGSNYTSARLTTQGKFDQAYGRFEARIRIPEGQGLWPAFWMLGNDIGTVGWPACGETDIMENIGKEPTLVHGTIHGKTYGPGGSYSLPGNAPFADDFHVYGIEWEVAAIRFYVDGTLYETRTPADIPSGNHWAFDHPFFLLLNVAVGGQWPGNPDGTTTFPQTMTVDYVRAYAKAP